ncbi:MAG TPA: NCS2 family permease [candidate division Zixibacteria bacterium]|nr:NCS2 family permease [candidate division Zixibacteria bacterium]
MIKKYFRFQELGTNYRSEITGGMTTFMAMAYIIFVNPAILSGAGMDFSSVMIATCLSAALATIIMGIWARYPIAQAPGLGLNAFFAYSVVLGMGISWEITLGAVFVAGVIFILLTLLKIREAIINVIPPDIQIAIAVGIGLFIASIGLWHAGLITKDPGALITLGPIHHPAAILSIIGIVLLGIMVILRIKGAILWSMIIILILGVAFKIIDYTGIVAAPPSMEPTFLKLDIIGALKTQTGTIILVFLFVDMFDTAGTLVGIGNQAGFMRDGKLPRASRALFSDAVGTTAGALMGTSTVTSYIESATGIGAGARSGFANIVTGLMFVLMIFFIPVARMAGGGVEIAEGKVLYPVTAPALIYVGSIMMRNITKIDWNDIAVAFPCFLVIIGIPLTYSIADGMAFGFITYPIFMLIAGRGREMNWLMFLLGLIFLAYYVFLK